MLNLSLAAVSRGEVRIQGEVSPEDPMWEGTGLALREPLSVDLRARSVGRGVLVRGPIRMVLDQECRRCLVPVVTEVEDTVELLFEPLEGEAEADELGGEVYPLPERGGEVDLRPALREQLMLRVPQYVLCREDCRGLCPHCGTDLNRSSCACVPEAEPSAWDALKKIKFD